MYVTDSYRKGLQQILDTLPDKGAAVFVVGHVPRRLRGKDIGTFVLPSFLPNAEDIIEYFVDGATISLFEVHRTNEHKSTFFVGPR